MTYNVPYFVGAILLLCAPLPYSWGRGGLEANRGRTPVPTTVGLLRAWQSWVDLARSVAGAWLLLQDKTFQMDAGDASVTGRILYLRAAILGAAVFIHSIRFSGGINIYAPLFFLTGITVMVPAGETTSLVYHDINLGCKEGWFAVVFAWVFAAGLRNPQLVAPAMGVALMAAGYFLSGMSFRLQLGIGLVVTPLILSVLFQKRLQLVSRERALVRIPPVGTPSLKAEKKSPETPMGSSVTSLK